MSFPPDLAVGDRIIYFQTVPIKRSRLYTSPDEPHWYHGQFQGQRIGNVRRIDIKDGARTLTIQNPPEDPGRKAMATPVSQQWPGDEYDSLTEDPKAERIVMKPSKKALQAEQIMRGSLPIIASKPGAANLPPETKNEILVMAGLSEKKGTLYRRALNGDPTLMPRTAPCSSSSCTISRKSNRKRSNKTRRTTRRNQRTKQNR